VLLLLRSQAQHVSLNYLSNTRSAPAAVAAATAFRCGSMSRVNSSLTRHFSNLFILIFHFFILLFGCPSTGLQKS
jgi:hypothetical protein